MYIDRTQTGLYEKEASATSPTDATQCRTKPAATKSRVTGGDALARIGDSRVVSSGRRCDTISEPTACPTGRMYTGVRVNDARPWRPKR